MNVRFFPIFLLLSCIIPYIYEKRNDFFIKSRNFFIQNRNKNTATPFDFTSCMFIILWRVVWRIRHRLSLRCIDFDAYPSIALAFMQPSIGDELDDLAALRCIYFHPIEESSRPELSWRMSSQSNDHFRIRI
jgi:hypothetical protein